MDRKGKENFPQTGTENFPLLISTFLRGQERKTVFIDMVGLSMTTTKLLPIRNLMSRKKRKENVCEKSLPGEKIKR